MTIVIMTLLAIFSAAVGGSVCAGRLSVDVPRDVRHGTAGKLLLTQFLHLLSSGTEDGGLRFLCR